MGIFDKLKKTAADNSDTIEDGIDTAADLAKDKVDGGRGSLPLPPLPSGPETGPRGDMS